MYDTEHKWSFPCRPCQTVSESQQSYVETYHSPYDIHFRTKQSEFVCTFMSRRSDVVQTPINNWRLANFNDGDSILCLCRLNSILTKVHDARCADTVTSADRSGFSAYAYAYK